MVTAPEAPWRATLRWWAHVWLVIAVVVGSASLGMDLARWVLGW